MISRVMLENAVFLLFLLIFKRQPFQFELSVSKTKLIPDDGLLSLDRVSFLHTLGLHLEDLAQLSVLLLVLEHAQLHLCLFFIIVELTFDVREVGVDFSEILHDLKDFHLFVLQTLL